MRKRRPIHCSFTKAENAQILLPRNPTENDYMNEMIAKMRRQFGFKVLMIGATWNITWINMENGEPLSFTPWCYGSPTGELNSIFWYLPELTAIWIVMNGVIITDRGLMQVSTGDTTIHHAVCMKKIVNNDTNIL